MIFIFNFLLFILASLPNSCQAIQCYTGVAVANTTLTKLVSKTCPTGTTTCKNETLGKFEIWLFGIPLIEAHDKAVFVFYKVQF